VISAATAVRSQDERDTIERIDRDGHLALIEIAEAESIGKFVYVSFPELHVDCDCLLQQVKRLVEARLTKSRMRHTILRSTNFCEVWLGATYGFDPLRGRARILGSGDGATNWISIHDVARFAVASVHMDVFDDEVLDVGGLDPLSQLQVLDMYEALGVTGVVRDHLTERELRDRKSHATTSLEEAKAAIALSTAFGVRVDPIRALDLLPGRMVSVRDYVQRSIAHSAETKQGGSHG
jgi:hypothetical protein